MVALPLLSHSFRATVAGETVAFTEVSGLAIEREQATYRHGFSQWEGEDIHTYRSPKHQRVTLSRGAFAGDGRFFAWLVDEDAGPRPMEIAMIDAAGAAALIWRIRRAVPVKLGGPTLTATGTDVAVETLEVMASGITVARP
jgi:phage tail-like protein